MSTQPEAREGPDRACGDGGRARTTCEAGVMPVEERGPSSRSTQNVVKDPEIGSMILEPPDSVQKLQTALQAKAKGSPGYRFYLLYDKLYCKDVLEYAYRCCKANRGAPGVDQQNFVDIVAYGEDRWARGRRSGGGSAACGDTEVGRTEAPTSYFPAQK